ncbi:MAG TPA: STAS/SEC14 domain-containing protein [bacterium]
MANIQVKARLSYNELLKAVEQLNPKDLETFLSYVISLRARKKGKYISKPEADLLIRINQKIDPKIQKRYDALISKRRTEDLTSEEYKELLQLSDLVENIETKRVKHLSQLAELRHTSLKALMKELGIQTPYV